MEERDAIARDWYGFLEWAIPDADVLLVPNAGISVVGWARRLGLDGLILSGGDDPGSAPERDETERSLLADALDRSIPVLGVCRGLQFIQLYFGGRIRGCDRSLHVSTSHAVTILDDHRGPLAAGSQLIVNSYHTLAAPADALGADLVAFAVGPDRGAEGLFHRHHAVMGVQWHPERTKPFAAFDRWLVRHALGMEAECEA
ncbi:MAG: gamma-glutamyl-gamma-aminobutyrate hydrolase family protein [Holophagales bacterium]|nr:gamma-glutamyl-gamma-aminobutyrate hydrolase family protein [Holophagales bacterium]